MASYKKLYEATVEEVVRLNGEVNRLKSLDVDRAEELTEGDAKDFVLTFADRCHNRAEVNLLLRIAKQLGA